MSTPKYEPKFATLQDALSAASYIESLHTTELQWITNRLGWLFVSQSFCITAYVILATSSAVRTGLDSQLSILRVGLPLLGILSCFAVFAGVQAAGRVARDLADERSRITAFINEHYQTTIPRLGLSSGMRTKELGWTIPAGSCPQYLPLALVALWFCLLIRF